MKHVALLRGINVGGAAPVRMPDLRDALSRVGLRDVETYLQSGNVVFDAEPGTDPKDLARRIAACAGDLAGTPVAVLVRTAGEWRDMVDRLPFSTQASEPPTDVYVTFLDGAPGSEAASSLSMLRKEEGEEFRVFDREVYLRCPFGYGRTKLSNAAFERRLGQVATTRNWRTVLALQTMLDAGARD